jgi:hypothetical protein
MSTYTGFIRFSTAGFPDTIEEIDVKAGSMEEARELIQKELDADYQPGGVIAHIEQRLGFFA